MRMIAYHFASGNAFFSGMGMLIVAVLVGALVRKPWVRRFVRMLAVAGVLFVALSATPQPWWLYSLIGIAVLLWLTIGIPKASVTLTSNIVTKFSDQRERPNGVRAAARIGWRLCRPGTRTSRSRLAGIALIVISIVGILLELPYHLSPTINGPSFTKLYLIGDSISAGMLGPKENTRPKQFRSRYNAEMIDLSQEGETAKSALKKTALVTDERALVLLEIGGNDILGSTSVADFEATLNQLLSQLVGPERTLVMMELPLPPFYNRYGQIQRKLAAQYRVQLIPKRYFINVLGGEDTTLDGLHLSENGHAMMAATVWALLRNSLKTAE